MSDLDVIPLPGYPGLWDRRVVVERWDKAGRPPVRWAGRTYDEQKYLWNGWRNKLPGFNPADNPDADTRQPHVRGMALDLKVWDANTVRRMKEAGFVQPIWKRNGFSGDEPWHFEPVEYVGKMRTIPKVIAAPSGDGSTPFIPIEEALMANATIIVQRANSQLAKGVFDPEKGKIVRELNGAPESAVWRGVEQTQSVNDLQVVFVQVSDAHYAALKK